MDEPFFAERPAEGRHAVLAGTDRVVPVLLPGDVEDRAGHGERDAWLGGRRVLLVGRVIGDRLHDRVGGAVDELAAAPGDPVA